VSRLLVVAALFVGLLGFEHPRAQAPATQAPKRPAATARPAARAERTVPFQAGETLSYDVSWSAYLTAGTATVSVREKRASLGSTAYYIVAEGQPISWLSRIYAVYYKADTLLDVYTLLPQRGSLFSREGGRTQLEVTSFDHAARKGRYEVQAEKVERRDLDIPPQTQDPLSALYFVRTLAMKPGTHAAIPVTNNGEAFTLRVTVHDRETVRTGLGPVAAWKVLPVIVDDKGRAGSTRELSIWLSDDHRRLPVRLRAELPVGSFDLTLRAVSR
jgi:hypothetical protein